MYYSKIREVSHDEAADIINNAIESHGLTLRDLVKEIGYPFEHKGLEDIKLFFSGKHPKEKQLRVKIGNALGIDREILHGERGFERYEDYCRFDFKPYLVRIPENIRPNQITSFGFVGFERVFIVGRYKNLLNMPFDEQLEFIREEIQKEIDSKDVTFFGEKLGYAYYYDYEKPAIPLSLVGNILENMEITYRGHSTCSVSMRTQVIAEAGHFVIPRLTARLKRTEEE